MEEQPKTEIEMMTISNGNDGGAAHVNGQDVPKDEIDGFVKRRNEPETEKLLENESPVNGNIVVMDHHRDTEAQNPVYRKQKRSAVCRVKEELSYMVCKRVPLWLVIVLIFVLIICVIFASLALCRVIYEDVDEKYDPTQFDVHRNFSGSFQLPNLNFTEEQLNGSLVLAAELENKLNAVYRNSPALGRYYSTSDVYDFSDDPVTASFRLMFLMPAAEQSQLSRFTLSKGMVYNVLRQFLFDQEEDESDRVYIEPASLNISE